MEECPTPIRVEDQRVARASAVLRDGLGRAVWQQTVELVRGANAVVLVAPATLPPGVYQLTIGQGAQQRRVTLTRQ